MTLLTEETEAAAGQKQTQYVVLCSSKSFAGKGKQWQDLGVTTADSKPDAIVHVVGNELPDPGDRKGLEFRAVPFSSWKDEFEGEEGRFTVRRIK
jgi:hypothetical protein